jgi:hypothetical protein
MYGGEYSNAMEALTWSYAANVKFTMPNPAGALQVALLWELATTTHGRLPIVITGRSDRLEPYTTTAKLPEMGACSPSSDPVSFDGALNGTTWYDVRTGG